MQYRWRCTFRDAYYVCCLIWPWAHTKLPKINQVIDHYGRHVVNGKVRIKLLKGNVVIEGRTSPNSLYDENLSTFEDDDGSYDQRDAEGFIKINSLRLRKK